MVVVSCCDVMRLVAPLLFIFAMHAGPHACAYTTFWNIRTSAPVTIDQTVGLRRVPIAGGSTQLSCVWAWLDVDHIMVSLYCLMYFY